MRYFLATFLFFFSFFSFGLEIQKPTERIVRQFYQSPKANTVSQNVMPVAGNHAAIFFIEEKLINGELVHHYKTCLSDKVPFKDFLDAEQAIFLGFILAQIKDHAISNKACTFIDDHTACTKAADGYICETIIKKALVDQLRALDRKEEGF